MKACRTCPAGDMRGVRALARRDGQREFRSAAIRMFAELGDKNSAMAIGLLEVDKWLPQDGETLMGRGGRSGA